MTMMLSMALCLEFGHLSKALWCRSWFLSHFVCQAVISKDWCTWGRDDCGCMYYYVMRLNCAESVDMLIAWLCSSVMRCSCHPEVLVRHTGFLLCLVNVSSGVYLCKWRTLSARIQWSGRYMWQQFMLLLYCQKWTAYSVWQAQSMVRPSSVLSASRSLHQPRSFRNMIA